MTAIGKDAPHFGRALSGTGSHASHEAPAGLRPSGFDPARDETTLLVADRDKPLAYLELDDATLGKFARHHLIETNKAAGRDAVGREMPLVISLAMHAKVALAHLYTAVFGEADHVWEMHVQGLSWKGRPDAGDWLITVRRAPAIATEARRAETPKDGSVHEGAVPERQSPKDGSQ